MYAPLLNGFVLLIAVVLSPLVDEVCHRLIKAPSRKENEIQLEGRISTQKDQKSSSEVALSLFTFKYCFAWFVLPN